MVEIKLQQIARREPSILGHEEFFKSAVLLPLVKYQGELCVLFEKRSQELDKQPGEICFPGGAIEETDDSGQEAAIRETCEELGLSPGDIEIVGPLDVFVSPFNVMVYPFVATIKDESTIRANAEEVEYVFFVPLNYLLHLEPPSANMGLKLVLPEGYPYDLIPNARNYSYQEARMPQYFYLWEKEVIWGLTARILNHFIKLIK